MTEQELIKNHEARLVDMFGPDYRNNPAYARLLHDVEEGTRTLSNIFFDYERVPEPSARRGW